MKTTDELNEAEQVQLAREIAADKYHRNDVRRDAFIEGWDAAMEHVEKQHGKT
jgi:hypothetical protein